VRSARPRPLGGTARRTRRLAGLRRRSRSLRDVRRGEGARAQGVRVRAQHGRCDRDARCDPAPAGRRRADRLRPGARRRPRADPPPLLAGAPTLAGTLTPRAPALALANRDFSSDPAAAAAMDADPLVSQPPGPARTAAGLVEGMREIWKHVDHLTMPILAL